MMPNRILAHYFFPGLLLCALIGGGIFGYVAGPLVQQIKPLGELFLHLIFVTIVPLVFFSVASAFSKMQSWRKSSLFFSTVMLSFLITGLVAAGLALLVVKLIPIGNSLSLQLPTMSPTNSVNLVEKIISTLSVSHFMQLFSHENMIALLIFAMLIGIVSSKPDQHSQRFAAFLQSGEVIFMRVFNLIMYYAPIGFFAYFASLVQEIGPQILGHYARVTLIYYVFGISFLLIVYSYYAYFSDKQQGLKRFWRHIFLPASTALATCSSAATIPANLIATKAMKVPDTICETVIPLGTFLHKEGSIIGGIFKIAFLFGIYHLDFSSASVLLTAIAVSLLVGTVMGAIPSGGMLGELLILSVYGFPPSALFIISAISILIDPLATVLNTLGNTINCLLITKFVGKQGKSSGLNADL